MSRLVLLAMSGIFLSSTTFAQLSFEKVTGERTGIAKQMADWRIAELKRHEGRKATHKWWPWGLRAFDYDNDGDLDLIASHHGHAKSKIYRNQLVETQKLTFVDVSAELGLNHMNGPAADDRPWIWDFDGDGFLDIASITDEGRTPILFNQGGKKFVAGHPSFTVKGLSHPSEVLDMNGDGYLDMDGGYKGLFFYNPETKQFDHKKETRFRDPAGLPEELRDFKAKYKKQFPKGNRFFQSAAHTCFLNGYDTIGHEPAPIDINHDGIGDVIISGQGGYGGHYLGRYAVGDKNGKFTDFSASTKLPLLGACPVYWGDLNNDGTSDIMLAGKNGGVYLNDGRGVFTKKASAIEKFLTSRGPYLLRAFRADFDNDGDFDFVMSNPRKLFTEIYESNGDGTFKLYAKLGTWDCNANVICDINNDGLLDLVIGAPGGHRSTDVHVYLNKTNRLKHAALIKTRMGKPNLNAVGSTIKIVVGGKTVLYTKTPIDGKMLSFGLGSETSFGVRIAFPNGKSVTKTGLTAGKVHVIHDTGKTATE